MDRSKMVNTNQILYPAKNARRWFGMDYEVSMYLPSHPLAAVTEKGGYEDFDAGIPIANSIELLMKDLTGKPTPSLIGFGTMVDPYNPSEEQSRLTRSALEIIHSNHQGVILFTKGEGILQDLDLLKKIAEDAFVVVVLIITSMNDELTKKIEPHAPLSSTRFKTLHKLANEKIKTGVLMMPIIPFITDTEENVTQIIRRSKEMGAEFIYPSFGINLTETDGQQFHKID